MPGGAGRAFAYPAAGAGAMIAGEHELAQMSEQTRISEERTRDTMAATMSPATAREQLDEILRRHEQEREEAADRLLHEEREEVERLRAAFHPEVGTALAAALDEIEAQIRRDRRDDRLYAKQATAMPTWAQAQFPPMDPADRRDGRRDVVVFVDRPYADGSHDPIAYALVDVSDAVFGTGARARMDQLRAAQRAGMEADAERDRREREVEEATARRRGGYR